MPVPTDLKNDTSYSVMALIEPRGAQDKEMRHGPEDVSR
jgi:hypothetical protein